MSHLRKVDLADRGHVDPLPCLHARSRTLARTQQEFAQPVTGAQLVLLGSLACSHQITQCLGTFIRNPHRRQIAGPVTAR